MSHKAEEERRYKIIYIEEGDRIDRGFDPDILPPLNNVPNDVIVSKRWFADERRAVGFLIAHDSFDVCPSDFSIPVIEPEY